MVENVRRSCTPVEYIAKLFEETRDGKLEIQYFPMFDNPFSLTYKMNWSQSDAESLVERYNALTAALNRIGELNERLDNADEREKLLTPDELKVWETYIRPFEPFDGDCGLVAQLSFRSETETLEDEEYELLDRHHDWFVANSRKRLAYDNWCPARLINRAQRYATLVELGAPDIVILEEGRCLAEEMALYYHAIKEIKVDSLKFLMAQNSTYKTALAEIKNGKKLTHWMWFIFPQVSGLAFSDTARKYSIADLDEAWAYLTHDVLGARLVEISTALLELDETDPEVIFGDIDSIKLRSSMTLFSLISEDDSVFHRVLGKFFDGQRDPETLRLLGI